MIIARPVGGLANQMSVYAAARALAEKHNVPLKIDLAGLTEDKLHELEKLSIKLDIATEDEIKKVSRISSNKFVEKIKKKLRRKLGLNFGVYKESTLSFDDGFFDLQDNTYIWGNFASIKYYDPIISILRNEFKVKSLLSDETKKWETKIKNCNAVSLHIRRGDYANDTKTREYHGLLPISYYEEAIEEIMKRTEAPEFFIFSDDLEWVKESLKVNCCMHFVDANDSQNGYQDYHLMLQCSHHIIANSGFSRWPAYLNDKQDKIVCMPKVWFKGDSIEDGDLGVADWVRIAN